jgi:hypothetical protein
VALFGLLVVACALGIAAAIGSALGQGDGAETASAEAAGALSDARADHRPTVVFRGLAHDPEENRGQVAVAAVDHPGQRTLEAMHCDRVHFAAGRGICLARGDGFAAGYRATVFGADFRALDEVALDGIPSRARVSPDGRYGAVTVFVTGHAYADAGAFSTQTTLIDLERGHELADLEQFTVTMGGRQVTAVDRNFWGVTFARDSNVFYATMATGGKTYLVRGSVSARTARVIDENVECPSLSPYGTRIAFKKRVGSGANPWRLAVLDLDTMRETLLAETRSVDDQAEWLGEDRVLYGIDGAIWAVRTDGHGTPRRFIADADSPAGVRW